MNFGKGRRIPGVMNKLEARYAADLALLTAKGFILWYAYEAVRLTLAKQTTYTPDFMVMRDDCTIEFHEVKGFWTQSARVKIKVAAEKFPFKFIAIKYIKNQWVEELF